mmetsp:Transcript_1243/g.2986  ORF Transcript_1243/g.2986 Transcript_1243/m.2986 type:complete len:229 (-) Transcript_1243:835-1521(-)
MGARGGARGRSGSGRGARLPRGVHQLLRGGAALGAAVGHRRPREPLGPGRLVPRSVLACPHARHCLPPPHLPPRAEPVRVDGARVAEQARGEPRVPERRAHRGGDAARGPRVRHNLRLPLAAGAPRLRAGHANRARAAVLALARDADQLHRGRACQARRRGGLCPACAVASGARVRRLWRALAGQHPGSVRRWLPRLCPDVPRLRTEREVPGGIRARALDGLPPGLCP